MRALGILISILIAVTTPCLAQEGSRYIRDAGPDSPVIIFLHGVLGDSKTTWSDGKAYWPELLAEDDAFSGTSIFVHEYKTEMFKSGQLNIDELAEDLKVRLDAAGVMQHGQLIFIVHSMGGLIARTFLLKYGDMANKTRFIFFLSTPTSGATIANWAELVSRNNPQFREMRRMQSSDFLANIQRNWMDKGYTCTIPSYCLYEKKETYATLVVDQGSASSLCNKPLVPVQADHIGIAKPSNRSAVQYQAFRNDFNAEIFSSKLDLVDRGVAYLAKPDYKGALDVFDKAIRLDQEYVPAIKNRGAVYLATSDWGRAIKDYNKAIYLEPKYAEHYYNRGASYSGIGDYDQAIADYTEAIRLKFYNEALARYYRGIAKQRKGDEAGGQDDIAKARAVDPNVGK